jgi:hypothetical protein
LKSGNNKEEAEQIRRTLIPGFLALLLSSTVQAAGLPDWFEAVLKVDNQGELPVFVGAGKKCPIKTEELTEIVSGVLIRSRIKSLPHSKGDEWLERNLFLNVLISCLEADSPSSSHIFVATIVYGNARVTPLVNYAQTYTSYGRGPKDYMVTNVKLQVENAVTDFNQANIDL